MPLARRESSTILRTLERFRLRLMSDYETRTMIGPRCSGLSAAASSPRGQEIWEQLIREKFPNRTPQR